MELDLLSTFNLLENRENKVLKTQFFKDLIHEIILPNYRRGNSLYQTQMFLNGNKLEVDFYNLNNPILQYKELGHGILIKKELSNAPDFTFNLDGTDYTIDTKTFNCLYNNDPKKPGFNQISTTKFECANFVIAYIRSEKNYFVRVRNSKNKYAYSAAIKMTELNEQLQYLIGWIKLPKQIKMLNFGVNNLTDDQIPEEISYTLEEYNLE